jgi:hypothetical protein
MLGYVIYQIISITKPNHLSTKITTFLIKDINIEKTYTSYVHKSSWDRYIFIMVIEPRAYSLSRGL